MNMPAAVVCLARAGPYILIDAAAGIGATINPSARLGVPPSWLRGREETQPELLAGVSGQG